MPSAVIRSIFMCPSSFLKTYFSFLFSYVHIIPNLLEIINRFFDFILYAFIQQNSTQILSVARVCNNAHSGIFSFLTGFSPDPLSMRLLLFRNLPSKLSVYLAHILMIFLNVFLKNLCKIGRKPNANSTYRLFSIAL